MTRAILFGAIGTLAETSELQRQSFNAAFAEAGLDWTWSGDEYNDMLLQSGGRDRIAAYADAKGESVDADALHRRKSEIFQERLADGIEPRAGVSDVIRAALGMNIPVAFASTTSRENIDAILSALPDDIHEGAFAFIGHSAMVANSKPDPDIYHLALERLGLEPGDAIAIEDSPSSAQSAVAAGIPTIAFPGAPHADHLFPNVDARVDALKPELFGLGHALGQDTLRASVA